MVADVEELEKLDASEKYPRKLNVKDVLITHKKCRIGILVTNGSAKLSGRDHKFQEPNSRQEETVRIVFLSMQ